jgi:DNA-binding FadR family transcriptional regulator
MAARPLRDGPSRTTASIPPASLPSGAAAVLRPVRGGNAFEETVERLLQALKLGVVERGERLPPQRELAARLAVSRETLREALHELEVAGYVQSRRGRFGGTFVTYRPVAPPTTRRRIPRRLSGELTDALAFRQVIEPGAAALAAGRALSTAERDFLLERQRTCAVAARADYRQLDSRLHLAVAELSGSPSLSAGVADVRMRLNDLLDAIPLLARNIAHANHQHAAIVAAILAGDPAGAHAATAEHLDGTAALLRGFLG